MKSELDYPGRCRHGMDPDGPRVCVLCERQEEAETCPVCGCGNSDRLEVTGEDGAGAYVCDRGHGEIMWIVDHDGNKTWFEGCVMLHNGEEVGLRTETLLYELNRGAV